MAVLLTDEISDKKNENNANISWYSVLCLPNVFILCPVLNFSCPDTKMQSDIASESLSEAHFFSAHSPIFHKTVT